MLHLCGMNEAITECHVEAFLVNGSVFIDITLTEQNKKERKRRITAYQASLFLGSNQSASFRAPHTFLRYSLTLNSSTLTAWKNDRYFASLREICVFPLPGRPQKQIQNLSVAIGNILNGIEFSMLWCADAPGAAWGIGLYSLFVLYSLILLGTVVELSFNSAIRAFEKVLGIGLEAESAASEFRASPLLTDILKLGASLMLWSPPHVPSPEVSLETDWPNPLLWLWRLPNREEEVIVLRNSTNYL